MPNSESESDFDSGDSEYSNIIETVPFNVNSFHQEVEPDGDGVNSEEVPQQDFDEFVPYADEPLADPEWTEEYERQVGIENELREELQQRIDGEIPLESVRAEQQQQIKMHYTFFNALNCLAHIPRCKCGNCKVELLQNVYEAKCCSEMNACMESLQRPDVLEDVGETPPSCITLHPGFRPNCLEKWALKQHAAKYKQTDSQERFFRAVAYREYSQLVHGFLGGDRIPLPACAYHAIRKTFYSAKEFTGFEEN